MAVLIVFLFLLIVWTVFITVQFYNITFRGFAPFISSEGQTIQAIMQTLKEMPIRPDAQVFELGCGQAGFLRAFEDIYPAARIMGVEYSLLPLLLAKFQTSLKKSRISFRRENLFHTDLRAADIIYCYLNDTMMEKLKEKFQAECRPGTLIISNTFSLPGWPAKKVIPPIGWMKGKIYFYEVGA